MNRSAALAVGLVVLLSSRVAFAAVVPVSTAAQLKTAVAGAKAGDEIVLASGTYAIDELSCTAAGTQAQPIVVRAASPLGAVVELSGLEGFKVSAPNWHFEGLSIKGVCATDASCEHAFHVTGAASGFVARKNRIVDFNAQFKINAALIGPGNAVIPNGGLVEYNEVFDTHPRDTTSPVTKINIDTGDAWVVRGNLIHDYASAGGAVTYGAFMKSGSTNGVFERNLVLCKRDQASAGTIGLSFGGGGTGAQFCAPAFNAAVPCNVEHENGTMRNNIIANCPDVGVYLNRSKGTKLLHNTLIGTSGVDFRFDTTTGEARGNVLAGLIRPRDGAAAPTLSNNLVLTQGDFDAMYLAPLAGDLRKKGDLGALLGKAPAVSGVTDDYCTRLRSAPLDLGALQHSLGDCVTTTPPLGTPGPGAADGGADASASGSEPPGGPGPGTSPPGVDAPEASGSSDSSGGCTMTPSASCGATGLLAFVAAAVLASRRTRRSRASAARTNARSR